MQEHDLSKLEISERDRNRAGTESPRRSWIKLALVVAAIAAAGLLLGLSGWLEPAIGVQTVKISKIYPARALTVLNAAGYVVAQRKAAVSSKATGRLAKLLVEEGQAVKQDQVIAWLENEDLKATLEEARAALRVAKAGLKTAQAELNDATLNYNRRKALRETGAVSEQEHDTAEARYMKAVAAERSAKFGVERAQAAVRVAEVNLEYSYIRAPFAGVILTKNADEGEVVAPFGGSLNSKAAVVTMADMESLMVEVDVSESNLEKVKMGEACEIRLDALPSDRFAGFVHTIVPTADRSKATVLTKVRFARLDPRALPEMSAKAAFLSRPLKPDEHDPVLAIPQKAIHGAGQSAHVFVMRKDRAKLVSVKTGRTWGDTVETLSGPAEGASVVLKSDKPLADGAKIDVKQ